MIIKTLKLGMLPTNCYIVADPESKIGAVIDPADNARKILDAIAEIDITVKYIFITHAHFDHVLAASKVKQATGAALVIHKYDDDSMSMNSICSFHPSLKKQYEEIHADIFASDGDTFDVGSLKAEFIHTPGHTIGSCVIKIDNHLFSGDTIFRKQCGRCDLAGGNFSSMLDSLKKIHDFKGNFFIYPGHGEETTLEYERIHNPYMKMALERINNN